MPAKITAYSGPWTTSAAWYRLYGSPSTGTTTSSAICPDLLSITDLGVADNWRGRLVRGVFRVLRWVTGL